MKFISILAQACRYTVSTLSQVFWSAPRELQLSKQTDGIFKNIFTVKSSTTVLAS